MVSGCLNAVFPALRAALVAGLMATVLLGTAVAGPFEDYDAYRQSQLGFKYLHGQGVPKNYAEALKWFRKAAEGPSGHAYAQRQLGFMYYNGQGVPKNYAEALKWFRKAAEQGDVAGQAMAGDISYNGQGVPKNYAEAVKWFRKAAEQGYVGGQWMVGFMYYNGQGVPKNYAEALKWFRKAANQGHAYAQRQLGFMYYNGQGVPKNYAEAVKWFRKAAEQGDVAGQAILGYLYEQGRGVPQNYAEAHMWYNLAASGAASDKKKHALYAKFRDFLANKMTPSQLAQAQVMAEQCLRSNYKDCGWPQVARQEDEVTSPPTGQNKVTSTGTGFFVSQNGHIVTNAHVVHGCRTVRASRGGSLRNISTDEASDLAVFIASEKPNYFVRLRGGYGARTGEPVVAVGFPLSGLLSSDPIVTTGTISALSGLKNDRRTIQITAPVQPGNSGGPLLGEDGSVVGVVVGKLDAMKVAEVIGDIPQNVNFAVSLGTLQSFLNANGVDYVLDDSKQTKSPADIAAEAARYTVLLECLR